MSIQRLRQQLIISRKLLIGKRHQKRLKGANKVAIYNDIYKIYRDDIGTSVPTSHVCMGASPSP
jgi:hypothetical protein